MKQRKGFGVLEIVIGILLIGLFSSVFGRAQRLIRKVSHQFMASLEAEANLSQATGRIIEYGRLSEKCEKVDEDQNEIYELKCEIDRPWVVPRVLEVIRFRHLPGLKTLLVERLVEDLWKIDQSFKNVTAFSFCDAPDLIATVEDPDHPKCPIAIEWGAGKANRFSEVFHRIHSMKPVLPNFFWYQISTVAEQAGKTFSMRGAFFVRNSVRELNSPRYAWGWTD